ncbi:MAG: VWA domain-containing protein [Bryobacteraceae bacterium]
MCILALYVPSLSAQLARPQLPLRRTPPTDQASPAPSIKVDVNLVLVGVTVADGSGKMIEGLELQQFKLFESNREQNIVSFSVEDAPVSVGLVFDASGSMVERISTARQATRSFLDTLEPADEAMLITFADRPTVREGFTRNLSTIQAKLLSEDPEGQTALVDAVYFALARMRTARQTRKALVVVSDGLENHSRYSERELMQLAVEADTQIFTIGVHGRVPASSDDMHYMEVQSAISLLDEMATRTGGIHFMIEDFEELEDVMEKIARALHSRYVLGYYSTNSTLDGKWRRISVKVRRPRGVPAVSVYTRPGYYAPEED